ncbi:hypothetical protein QW060_27515 [Myroides ceti]|uniref:Peptidase M13 N-terminal domain-containing protein n=1 Tax=Paenimyroides ceti TaxID=395087 RepID=A0ABT8D565_9FLAO|nr:hypothetical protein [Paenimyroides ceti]MDN3710542.1 hypothetical protein [Paenimyroides ceti]
MNRQIVLFSALSLTIITACKTKKMDSKKETHGIHLEYMDRSVKPGDDFFRYVNGHWVDKTEIPADRTRWGSFDELRQNTDIDALAILRKLSIIRILILLLIRQKPFMYFKPILIQLPVTN